MDESEKTLELQKVEHVISLFGNFDENVRIIEESLNVRIISGERGHQDHGRPRDVEKHMRSWRSWLP